MSYYWSPLDSISLNLTKCIVWNITHHICHKNMSVLQNITAEISIAFQQFMKHEPKQVCQAFMIKTRSSESDGRSDVTDSLHI